MHDARSAAASEAPVLIRGESGAGKHLLASVVHHCEARGPMVVMNCGDLPAELLEEEIFGVEAVGFPERARSGALEAAGRGTLVIDEVATLSMPLQAKLLRAIEQKRFQRAGGRRFVNTTARVIVLTSADLERAVERRTFRQDLYYLLNVVTITVPPLRERRADILPLATHFVRQISEVHRKPLVNFSCKAANALEKYSFPGNVRELRNIVECAMMKAAPPEILLEDLPLHLRMPSNGEADGKVSLEELERSYIAEVLEYTGGKKTRASEILGISRKTLLEKRKRYGLE